MTGWGIFKFCGHRYVGSDNSDNSSLIFYRGYCVRFNFQISNMNNRDYNNS